MAEIVKPSEKPEWASTNPGGIVTPSNSKKQTGWSGPPEKPPFQFFNWFQNLVYKWVLWFEEKVELTFGGKQPTTLTINNGNITPTGSQHSVDTEALAASDTLSNILPTNLSEGRVVIISCVSTLRVVTIQHNAGGLGSIETVNGLQVTLDDPKKMIAFVLVGTVWKELFRTFQGLLSAVNETAGGFEPTTDTLDWGSNSFRWDVWARNFAITGAVTGNLIPSTDNTSSVGSSAFQWQAIKAGSFDTGTSTSVLSIGDTNATIINIGRTGATVNFLGAVANVTVTNTNVTDQLVTFNKNGVANSASNSGLELEENAIATAHIKTTDSSIAGLISRIAWRLKAPLKAGERILRASSLGVTEGNLSSNATYDSVTIDAGETYTHYRLTLAAGTTFTVNGTLVTGMKVSTGANFVSTGGTVISQF